MSNMHPRNVNDQPGQSGNNGPDPSQNPMPQPPSLWNPNSWNPWGVQQSGDQWVPPNVQQNVTPGYPIPPQNRPNPQFADVVGGPMISHAGSGPMGHPHGQDPNYYQDIQQRNHYPPLQRLFSGEFNPLVDRNQPLGDLNPRGAFIPTQHSMYQNPWNAQQNPPMQYNYPNEPQRFLANPVPMQPIYDRNHYGLPAGIQAQNEISLGGAEFSQHPTSSRSQLNPGTVYSFIESHIKSAEFKREKALEIVKKLEKPLEEGEAIDKNELAAQFKKWQDNSKKRRKFRDTLGIDRGYLLATAISQYDYVDQRMACLRLHNWLKENEREAMLVYHEEVREAWYGAI
ncbi:hypothetical protein GCK72_012719 [Caenorhabditis remanei]|uniref:CUT domain-containing protein n=1 Tax=Caenorhabditis remanei TaxID=31234 RepID=A0A6A5GP50_CAERE|nr:hypothetical protein GCK72_012719 [Caenorhabditis remanei]KAF1756266.1 hypothetical protein GCK72_012719 [Caenorhabditis remanei]